jgi:hypothetical protein
MKFLMFVRIGRAQCMLGSAVPRSTRRARFWAHLSGLAGSALHHGRDFEGLGTWLDLRDGIMRPGQRGVQGVGIARLSGLAGSDQRFIMVMILKVLIGLI